jgi:hypothetical protein
VGLHVALLSFVEEKLHLIRAVNGLMVAEASQEANDVLAAVADEILLCSPQEGFGGKSSQKDTGPKLIQLVLPCNILGISSGDLPAPLLVLHPHSVVDMSFDVGCSHDDELNVLGNLKLIDVGKDLCYQFLEEFGRVDFLETPIVLFVAFLRRTIIT